MVNVHRLAQGATLRGLDCPSSPFGAAGLSLGGLVELENGRPASLAEYAGLLLLHHAGISTGRASCVSVSSSMGQQAEVRGCNVTSL